MRFAPVVLNVADRSRIGDGPRGSRRHRRARSKPVLEFLERRALLAAITEFPTLSTNALPAGIASGIVAVPGGNIWFTEPGVNKIGEISTSGAPPKEFPVNSTLGSPQGITFGPDGNLWFTEAAANKIGVMNTSGVVLNEYPITTAASDPQGITAGPDGNLWFTEAATGKIAKIIPSSGLVTEYPVTTLGGQPEGITAGPDGNLWFTEPGANQIGKIAPTTGAVTEYPISTPGGRPQGITTGPDGNLWFTEAGTAKIGKISPSTGAVTDYAVPTPGGVTEGITTGSDGNLWFTEPGTAQVGRITPSGVVTEFATHTTGSQPWGITTGPDGNLWFTDTGASKVGQVALAQLIGVTGVPVTAQAGSPFTATIATFTPAAVNPQTANFTATIDWGDGIAATPGIITAGAQGTFNVSATKTYATAGTYQAQITVSDLHGAIATASSTITVAYAATGVNFSAVEGQIFNGQVASFSDPQTTGQVGQYSAMIAWGDSTTSSGVVSYSGGTAFTVTGSHTYTEESVYPVTVTVTGPSSRTFLAFGQATVADAPLSAVATTNVATTNVPFTGVVATFSDENPNGTASDFHATIVWGDGHTSAGMIAPLTAPSSDFSVTGTNTYMTSGSFPVQVTITDVGGATAMASSTITAAYKAKGDSINAIEGELFNGPVASFSDPQTTGQVGQYSAIINWGDSSPTTIGVITYTVGTSEFTVSGSHAYAEEGVYAVTVTVTGPSSRTFLASSQAVVADAPLYASAAAIQPTAGVPFTGVVATFTDGDPTSTIAIYQATIVWGDGNISAGIIAAPANAGYFTVTGSNTYAASGSYPLQVTITDSGGSTVTTKASTVSVGNVPVSISGNLNPASISGPSKKLNITNVNRPTFEGMTTPFSMVQLFAQAANNNPTVVMSLGQTMSGPDGAWSLTAPTLPDGIYTVTASITGQDGFPTPPVLIVSPDNPLVIDTVAPRVAGLAYDTKTGMITVVIDSAWTGLDTNSLMNPANYVLVLKRGLSGHLSQSAALGPAISGFYTGAQSATLQFEAPLAPGRYLFEVKSGGVIDDAGNALDGEFTGRLPSGDGHPGGNFIVQITVPKHPVSKSHGPRPSKFRSARHR